MDKGNKRKENASSNNLYSNVKDNLQYVNTYHHKE